MKPQNTTHTIPEIGSSASPEKLPVRYPQLEVHETPETALARDNETTERTLEAFERIIKEEGETALQYPVVATRVMRDTINRYRSLIRLLPPIDYKHGDTTIDVRQTEETPDVIRNLAGGGVFAYTSEDPFKGTLFEYAANNLAAVTLPLTRHLASSDNPQLTYLDSQRSKQGQKDTIITAELKKLSPMTNFWVTGLPSAEMLGIVSVPNKDNRIIMHTPEAGIHFVEPDNELLAMVGGGKDGIAVREREGWERFILQKKVNLRNVSDNTLVISSLGTGTAEPALDTGIGLIEGTDVGLRVHGYDIDPNSLKVAEYLAKNKNEANLDLDIELNTQWLNLLTASGIKVAVAGTHADVIEAIGFSEYVPSDFAKDPEEVAQRENMKKMRAKFGLEEDILSAEDYHRAIYDNMKPGAVFITGNMRDDSEQAGFVIGALGWKGIIQRDTKTYLEILERAGIPSDAIELYQPDKDGSTGVYNLICITKK